MTSSLTIPDPSDVIVSCIVCLPYAHIAAFPVDYFDLPSFTIISIRFEDCHDPILVIFPKFRYEDNLNPRRWGRNPDYTW